MGLLGYGKRRTYPSILIYFSYNMLSGDGILPTFYGCRDVTAGFSIDYAIIFLSIRKMLSMSAAIQNGHSFFRLYKYILF
jgi:hypothetical protein